MGQPQHKAGAAMLSHAYSLITVKALDEKRRTFSGWATTPELDRMSDTIDPMGAKFTNPLTLLHQHMSNAPIGTVTLKKPTPKGVEFVAEIPIVAEPGPLKDRVDTAWGEIKAGLVRAVSIGFAPIKYAFRSDGGVDYQEVEIYELSTVSVPANAGAMITSIKSIDRELREAAGVPEPPALPPKPKDAPPAAPGQKRNVVVRLTPPGVSGPATPTKTPLEGKAVNVSEKIAAFESKRAANMARIATIHEETDQSLDDSQLEEIKGLEAEVDTIDRNLPSLKRAEAEKVKTAKPVRTVEGQGPEAVYVGPMGTSGGIVVKAQPKLAPGIAFARLAKVKAIGRLDNEPALKVAERIYGSDSEVVAVLKAPVVAGSTIAGNWAAGLVGAETGAYADFAAFLRPATILGKFGTNGIPDLRKVPFREPLIIQTGGGAGYWVGEGKPKPLTAFGFSRTTMTPLKVANIAVLTEENIRSSAPSSEMIVRDALRDALSERMDRDFIDPTNAGTADVKPASITNGAAAIVSPGTNADAIRLGVRAVFGQFIAANNAPTSGVWIMSATNALALSMMTNPLGQREFTGISMNGGTFEGMPVIISEYAGNIVVLVNAQDVYEADEGEVSVDMSREASLEMKDSALTQDGLAGTGVAMVSLWQSNLVGLRAERTINWRRRRVSAVVYLTGVNWGGAVPES